jgi:hypothetical protein
MGRTGGAEVIRDGVAADLRIEGFDGGRHGVCRDELSGGDERWDGVVVMPSGGADERVEEDEE